MEPAVAGDLSVAEGQELLNDEAARQEASVALTEVARDVLLKDGLFHEF